MYSNFVLRNPLQSLIFCAHSSNENTELDLIFSSSADSYGDMEVESTKEQESQSSRLENLQTLNFNNV